jgi:hypothetical protein
MIGIEADGEVLGELVDYAISMIRNTGQANEIESSTKTGRRPGDKPGC